jgi:sigma-E factor negative regulatory protein RseC
VSGGSCSGTGVVERILPDGRAAVRVSRAEACMSCESKGACTALGGQVKDHILVIPNAMEAQPGQWVTLNLPESSVLGASAILYGLPAVTLIGGAALGRAAADALGLGVDPATALGAGLGMVLGLVGIYVFNRKLGGTARYQPRMVGVLGPAAD